MAIYNKIHSAHFVDDTASADVTRMIWLICDDADADYIGGTIIYDFINDTPSVQGIKDLSKVAEIKTAIDAIKLARAKDGSYFTANPLPAKECTYIKRDENYAVVSFQEVYKDQAASGNGGGNGGY